MHNLVSRRYRRPKWSPCKMLRQLGEIECFASAHRESSMAQFTTLDNKTIHGLQADDPWIVSRRSMDYQPIELSRFCFSLKSICQFTLMRCTVLLLCCKIPYCEIGNRMYILQSRHLHHHAVALPLPRAHAYIHCLLFEKICYFCMVIS